MGEALNQQQFRNRYPNGRATHVWQSPDGTYYDARDVKKTIAGKANRARNPNSKITAAGNLKTRENKVKSGKEITVSYGRSFRL